MQVGSQVLNTPELVQKIRQYRLLPMLVRELVTDQLIDGILCDQQVAYEQYCAMIPAKCDEAMRQRLLNEQFQALLNQELQTSPVKPLPKVELPDQVPQQVLKHA